MRKQLIALVTGFILLIYLTSLSSSFAAPQGGVLFQSTSETEPNNDFTEADAVAVPGYIIGDLTNTPVTETIDYFVLNTLVGREYQASLTIDSPDNLKLRMVLYNGGFGYLKTSTSSSTDTSMTWNSSDGSHYIRVEAVTVSTSTVKSADYRLDIDLIAATPTPTPTPMPGADAYEPNNTRETAYALPIATSANATDANFYPTGDEDWYAFYVKSGRYYRASTSNLSGVDTFIEVFNQDGNEIGSDNDAGGGFASKYEWESSYDGYYYVRVTNLVTSGSEDTYDLTVAEIGSPPTSTPAPGATAVSGVDSCENNFDFDAACVIAPDKTYTFNFLSPYGSGPDNDFFKLWVKPGLLFDCATSDLAAGVDPNMIVYNNDRNAIGGNDDVEPGNYNSAFSYYATYEGWLYLLVGTGDRTPSDPRNSSYDLRCESRVPGAATATRSPEATNTPRPGETAIPTRVPPTPAPTSAALTVRKLTTPTPAPATTPAPRFVPIDLLVYYDENGDRQPGAGEGVSGISAQAYEAATNQLLAQGFTDEQGYLEFSVSTQGPVRVSVPFFGFSQLVASQEGASIYLRVPPRAQGSP
jgi:hypothetical protein